MEKIDSCGSDKIIGWIVKMLQNSTFAALEMKSCDAYDTNIGPYVVLWRSVLTAALKSFFSPLKRCVMFMLPPAGNP